MRRLNIDNGERDALPLDQLRGPIRDGVYEGCNATDAVIRSRTWLAVVSMAPGEDIETIQREPESAQ